MDPMLQQILLDKNLTYLRAWGMGGGNNFLKSENTCLLVSVYYLPDKNIMLCHIPSSRSEHHNWTSFQIRASRYTIHLTRDTN